MSFQQRREFLTEEQRKRYLDREEGTQWYQRDRPPTYDEVVGHLLRLRNLYLAEGRTDDLVRSHPYYTEGDEESPFFSEAYLYCALGKEDARTVLAVLRTSAMMFEQLLGRPLPLDLVV